MPEPIDMLELAKRLIPDIETHMPNSVRQAFESGQVKSIFRTGAPQVNPDGMRNPITSSSSGRPSSTYFLLDDGRAARYGVDDNTIEWMVAQRAKGSSIDGAGWMGSRASVPKLVPNQDDPFVFDKILFGNKSESGLGLGGDLEKTLKESKTITDEPVVGKNIYETFSKDGKIITSHGGNTVTDVYTREGYATFYEDMANPIRGASPALVTKPVGDIDFATKTGKELPVALPFAKAAPPSPPVTTVSSPTTTTSPDPEPTSRLRGTLAGENAAPTTKPIQMDMYHGGFGLDEGLVDPAKHSSGRTPLPALTVSDEATARRYAKTGGPAGGFAGGNTYKLGLEFDSPGRIVGAFDPASDDFINFMRNSLPEEGVRAPLVPGGKPGVARYREMFDTAIGEMPEGDRTYYSVMDAVSNIHDKYRPLGEYDYLPRAQGSIEAKRFGIDALTWTDHGDEAMGLLDPHDVRSKTGRVNIRSLDNVTETLPAPTAAPSMEDLKKAGASTVVDTENISPPTLNSKQQEFLESIKAEKVAKETAAAEALPATKKSVEEAGYLYHYAPREARESILSGGLQVSKARTAVSDVAGEFSEFSKHVPENSMYFFTNPADAPSAATIFGIDDQAQRPDLYRVKIEPGMLDDMVVDPRLPLRGGVGSAVIVPSKTGSFSAELIGENAEFGMKSDGISPATYDPITPASPVADDLHDAEVTKTTTTNAPISQRRLDALEEMAESGTDAEREIARKKLEELRKSGRAPRRGPGDLGTRVDIRTEPSIKGTDAAAPPPTGASVTPKTPTATVTTDAPKVKPTAPPSSGAPPKGPSLMDNAAETARNIAKGHGNAKTLGIIGAATLLGVGYASTRNKKNVPRDQGTYMDESRRRLGY